MYGGVCMCGKSSPGEPRAQRLGLGRPTRQHWTRPNITPYGTGWNIVQPLVTKTVQQK